MADTKITYKIEIDNKNSLKSMEDLNQELDQMKSELNTLAVGSKAFDDLKNKVVQADSKMKNLNKSVEGMDMEALAGEAGKFAGGIGAMTGAMVLFGDESSETLQEMQENMNKGIGIAMGVKGAVEAITAGTKLFNAAMAANPIGTVVVAVLALTAAVGYLVLSYDDTTEAQKALNESTERGNELIVENTSDLLLMKRQLTDTNISQEKKKEIIEKINTSYGKYLPKLLTERSTEEEIAIAIDTVNKAYKKKLMMQANEELILEKIKEQTRLQAELEQDLADKSIWEDIGDKALEYAEKLGQVGVALTNDQIDTINTIKAKSDLEKQIDALIGKNSDLDDELSTLTFTHTENTEATEENTEATDKNTEANNKNAKSYENVTDAIKESLSEQKKEWNKYLSEKEQINSTIETYGLNETEIEIMNVEAKYAKLSALDSASASDKLILKKQLADELKAIDDDVSDNEVQNEIATAQAVASVMFAMSDLTKGEAEKGFTLSRTLALAGIAIDTAAAISSLVANSSANPTNAVTFGAAGAAQFAAGIIQIMANIGNAYSIINSAVNPQFEKGGILNGPSHEMGGIQTKYGEVEGGEAIINTRSTKAFAPILSKINEAGGGKSFSSGQIIDYDLLASKINDKKVYVVDRDMSKSQANTAKVTNRSRY